MPDPITTIEAGDRLQALAVRHGWTSTTALQLSTRFGIGWPDNGDHQTSLDLAHEIQARIALRLARTPLTSELLHKRIATVLARRSPTALQPDVPQPHSDTSAVIFGRRRTTILCPRLDTVETYDEPGHTTIAAEIQARIGVQDVTSEVRSADIDAGVLVEGLLAGANLAASGPTAENLDATTKLHARWQHQRQVAMDIDPLLPGAYVEFIDAELGDAASDPVWRSLREHAARTPGHILRAPSHGDLRLSNVIKASDGETFLVDFESFDLRWCDFDATEFALRHRRPVSSDPTSRIWFAVERYRRSVRSRSARESG